MKKFRSNKNKVHPIPTLKQSKSFSQKTLGVIVTVLAIGGYNRTVFFNGKSKVIRVLFFLYSALFPTFYTYGFFKYLFYLPFHLHYSVNRIVITIEILADWLVSYLKGTKRLAIVYNNLNLLENKLASEIKVQKFKHVLMMLFVTATQVHVAIILLDFIIRVNHGKITAGIILDGTSLCEMVLWFNFDKVWSYYVFYMIRATLESIYKDIKRYKLNTEKDTVLGKIHDNRLKNLLEYYKKNVQCQEVMIDIINPMYVITILITHIRLGTHLYLTASDIVSKSSRGTQIWTIIANFIASPQTDIWLLLLLCFEGDKIATIDRKIEIILSDLLVDSKDSLDVTKTIQNFLRYIERKRDKLTIWRIVKLTLELPVSCFLNLTKYFVLVVQFLNISYIKSEVT